MRSATTTSSAARPTEPRAIMSTSKVTRPPASMPGRSSNAVSTKQTSTGSAARSTVLASRATRTLASCPTSGSTRPFRWVLARSTRAKTHRNGRVLPEVGHEARVRVAREARTVDLAAEPVEVCFVETAFEERPGIDAGGRVTLEVDMIARGSVGLAAEEVVVADLIAVSYTHLRAHETDSY